MAASDVRKQSRPQSLPKQYIDQSVYELSLERIRYIYNLFDSVAVSFSGGKDSTVTLNLAIQVATELGRLPVYTFFFDEEAIPYEVEDYVRRVASRPEVDLKWYCVPVKHSNACSQEQTYWIAWNPDEKDKWVRPLPPEAIMEIPGYNPSVQPMSIPELNMIQFDPAVFGRTCVMLGIRAAESLTRLQAVNRREEENFIVKVQDTGDFGGAKLMYGNTHKGYPIYDWEVQDVWTAPKKFGWDYCAAYDMMEMAGIAHAAQRVAPPFGTQPSRSLWMYKECFPDIWQKLQHRVPGANTAALYANTELYAAGKVEKPDGVAWPDWIQFLLMDIDEPVLRQSLAQEIRKNINTHVKKSGNAMITPYVPHPDTGVSYELLAKKIIRMDNKGRIRPDQKMTNKKNPEAYQKAWDKYNAAVAEYMTQLAGQPL